MCVHNWELTMVVIGEKHETLEYNGEKTQPKLETKSLFNKAKAITHGLCRSEGGVWHRELEWNRRREEQSICKKDFHEYPKIKQGLTLREGVYRNV